MAHHLAQVNIARMRAGPSDPSMAGIITRLDEMNRLAEQSKGFVWRLRGAEASPEALRVFADYVVPFEPERLFYNLSVWESVEYLRQYAFQSAHAKTLRGKQRWIDDSDRAHLALWWIPVGHVPTIAESAERLRSVHEKGPTDFAFTFKDCFPKPTG
jgi:Domain of unknown function (DUF3291)